MITGYFISQCTRVVNNTNMIFFISFLIVLTLSAKVNSDTVCEKCNCNYDSKSKQDFQGEIVDCSYTNGVLDMNFSLPSAVFSLDLSANNLTQLPHSNLFDSKTMIELFFHNNALARLEDNVFKLPKLKLLDLSDNELEFIDKDVFINMKALEYLNIANNKFTTFSKLTFHRLSGLKEVIMDNNNIGPHLKERNLFDRNGFGLTNKIEAVSIRGINLNSVPENFFVDAYAIKKLLISYNNLSYIFEIPYTLEYLDISDNPIKEISSEDFSDLPALRVLKLNNLSINQVPDFVFSPLRGLVSVELERNKNLTRFSRLAFGQEVLEDADDFTLEELSMRNCRLSSLSEDLMEPFSQLIKLDLRGNPWRCDCFIIWIKKLQIGSNVNGDVRCATPLRVHNSKIFELDNKYFACPSSRHYTGLAVASVSFCVTLAVVAVWLFVYVPRFQSRGNMLRSMANPATAYTVLPMHATLNDT